MTNKKFRKMTISPKQKMEDIYCVSCKKYTGTKDMSSKTVKTKLKLLRTKCEHDKSIFLKQIK